MSDSDEQYEAILPRKAYQIAVRDFFPTQQTWNVGVDGKKEEACWGGPGITIREYFVLEMAKALAPQYHIFQNEVHDGEVIIAEKAGRMADALLRWLADNEPIPEADND